MFKKIYPNGISRNGKLYLNPFYIDKGKVDSIDRILNNYRTFTIEYVFEMVRQMYYPMLPSRFVSLFACKSEEDVTFWYNLLKGNEMDASNTVVKKIEILEENTFICDSAWRDKQLVLDNGEVFSPFAYHELAKCYWAKEITEEPHM